jgi:hypothetical protein
MFPFELAKPYCADTCEQSVDCFKMGIDNYLIYCNIKFQHHSGVVQWQNNRLLTDKSQVRPLPPEIYKEPMNEQDVFAYMMAAEKIGNLLFDLEQTIAFLEEYKIEPDEEVRKALTPLINKISQWMKAK